MRTVNIEIAGFKKLMEFLEVGYIVPKIMHTVMAKHLTMRQEVMEQIKDGAGVSFTTNIVTSCYNPSLIIKSFPQCFQKTFLMKYFLTKSPKGTEQVK